MRTIWAMLLALAQNPALAYGNLFEACPGHTIGSLVQCAEHHRKSQFAEDVSLLPSLLLFLFTHCNTSTWPLSRALAPASAVAVGGAGAVPSLSHTQSHTYVSPHARRRPQCYTLVVANQKQPLLPCHTDPLHAAPRLPCPRRPPLPVHARIQRHSVSRPIVQLPPSPPASKPTPSTSSPLFLSLVLVVPLPTAVFLRLSLRVPLSLAAPSVQPKLGEAVDP